MAGLALRVAQAERASPLRAALYAEMLKAHSELAVSMVGLVGAAHTVVRVMTSNPDVEEPIIGKPGEDLIDAAGTFNRTASIWGHVLPERTLKAAGALYDAVVSVLDRSTGAADLQAAQAVLVKAMRAALSVEPLTEAGLRLSGQQQLDENDRLIEVIRGTTKALRRQG